jgi:multicomponent Na+:H+ antiporter subunit F
MNKTFSWLIGAIVMLTVVAGILYRPFQLDSFAELPHSDLLNRAINLLVLAAILCLARILFGPSAADRIVAIDILGILIVGLCGLMAVSSGKSWYLDIGIVWALQSFIGSLALAKHLEGRSFDD